MADITDERLREIVGTPLSLAPAVCNYVDAWYFAAELRAARARIKSLEGCLVRNMEAAIRRIPKAGAARCDPVMVALAQASQERDAARAEVERLRADLDEAMLLHGGENGKLPVSMRFPEYLDRIAKLRDRWMARREKHKETNQ